MANLATADEVKKVIQPFVFSDIDQFINTANLIVVANLTEKGLSPDTLKAIEINLSAHFITMAEGEISSDKTGDLTIAYNNAVAGRDFLETPYGRVAIQLDSSNTLRQMGKPKVYARSVRRREY